MSVYVGDLFPCTPTGRWRHARAAHLFATTKDELLRFAKCHGLRLSWFQDRPGFPHFDVTAAVRDRLIDADWAARPVSRREEVVFARRQREGTRALCLLEGEKL